MKVTGVVPQLRTTDLERAIRFYVETLGFELDFRYRDFYAGVRAGGQVFHLKRVDDADPSIAFVRDGDHLHLYFDVDGIDRAASELKERGARLLREAHDTPWGTREIALCDPDGHTLYFGQTARMTG
ncbi:MAG TPA: VOC family protein [Burkholderiales bacterium]|nr:VOC family protein [Burkholderiales bacterium]